MLHYWVWENNQRGSPLPRRESFRIFFIWDNSWYISAFTHSFYIWVWCAPGSAPTFLVFADMCGRAWRITSSTPQRCHPLLLYSPTWNLLLFVPIVLIHSLILLRNRLNKQVSKVALLLCCFSIQRDRKSAIFRTYEAKSTAITTNRYHRDRQIKRVSSSAQK